MQSCRRCSHVSKMEGAVMTGAASCESSWSANASRPEYLRFLRSPNTTTFADEFKQAAVARAHLLVILAPHITTADVPERLPPSTNFLSWVAPIALRRAMSRHPRFQLACSSRKRDGYTLQLRKHYVRYVGGWCLCGSSSST